MVKASAVAKVLGGEKTLGKRVSSQQDLITAVMLVWRVSFTGMRSRSEIGNSKSES